MDREHTCCFTGHRPDKLPWGTDERDPRCTALKRRLTDAIAAACAASPDTGANSAPRLTGNSSHAETSGARRPASRIPHCREQ